MTYSRLSFEVVRNYGFPEAALLWLLVSPAQLHGLRGQVEVKGQDRYSAILEGSPADIEGFHTYVVDYLEVAVGDVDEVVQTNGLPAYQVPAGVKIIMPE